ncbi:HNH endonuclease [Paracoccus aminovorans]|uniref:HNH endonuclease n=1 Tax=Paracoccus aminovorans TaxID=34004 RepID=UPI0009EADEC8|nr:HNH endonuclease [Paracoccus aminovorans]
MPRPPHTCHCGRTVPHGERCLCQIASTRARNRRHDARRPSARARGYTREWEKARAEFLRLHPYCAMCGADATLVDHIKPHRGDKALFWNWNNWQALCTGCHSSTKQRAERNQ